MKLQLDTVKKTIKIEGDVKLTKLMDLVKKLLPNGEWQDFTLLKNTTIEQWTNPIIYKEYYPSVRPWWEQPWINHSLTYYNSTSGNYTSTVSNTQSYQTNGQSTNISLDLKKKNVPYELNAGVFNVQV